MKKVINIILIILWMGLIFVLSNDTAEESSKKSDGLIVRCVQDIIKRNLSTKEKEKVLKYLVKPVRKSAHFFLYFVLGILIINLFKSFELFNYKMILLAILLCFLYACSDEIHQLFIKGRSCEVRDILIDTIGSLSGISVYYLFSKISVRKTN